MPSRSALLAGSSARSEDRAFVSPWRGANELDLLNPSVVLLLSRTEQSRIAARTVNLGTLSAPLRAANAIDNCRFSSSGD